VYLYNAAGDLVDLYKHKCEEYALDRKIRTQLSPLAHDLSIAYVRFAEFESHSFVI
jgi:hypothetical protein